MGQNVLGFKAGPLEGSNSFFFLRLGPSRGQKLVGLKAVFEDEGTPRCTRTLSLLRLRTH